MIVRLIGLTLTATVMFSSPTPAFAAKPPPGVKPSTISLTPTIGGFLFSGGESTQVSPLYGLKLSYDINGRNISDSLGIEGTFNYFSAKSTTGAKDVTGYICRLDAIYPFTPGKKWVPFIAIGLGGISTSSPSTGNEKSPLFNYGAGLKYFLEDWLAVRVDARHLLVYQDVNTRNDFELSAGLTYLFGKEHKKKPVPAPKPLGPAIPQIPDEPKPEGDKKPADTTKTPDKKTPPVAPDASPTEPSTVKKPGPGGAIVIGISPPATAAAAIPAAAPAAAVATPGLSAKAPAKGAGGAKTPLYPVDASALGYPDQAGKGNRASSDEGLPQLPKANEVQPPASQQETRDRLAAARKKITPVTVTFDINSALVQSRYYARLKAFASEVRKNPGAAVIVEGHTDSTGNRRFNIKLSRLRALSIKNILVKYGVAEQSTTIKGYGPLKPRSDNLTPEGRRRNRRSIAISTEAPQK